MIRDLPEPIPGTNKPSFRPILQTVYTSDEYITRISLLKNTGIYWCKTPTAKPKLVVVAKTITAKIKALEPFGSLGIFDNPDTKIAVLVNGRYRRLPNAQLYLTLNDALTHH